MQTLYAILNNSVYGLLAVLALWGFFCAILVWRRVAQTRFADEDEQEEFLGELELAVENGNYDAVTQMCEGDRRAMPQLALYAMSNRQLGFDKLRRRVAERFQQDVLSDIEHRLSWVATVIKAAPMMGLLGTVMGMMGAFANLSSGDKVDTVKMAADIQFALITTAIGLSIAVPLILATANINIRIRKMEDLVGVGMSRLFEVLKTMKA
jgi:biopolymer transport protein ExbB